MFRIGNSNGLYPLFTTGLCVLTANRKISLIVVIEMQVLFISPGGYVHCEGCNSCIF